jgi:chromosome segregation ATPase
MMSQPSTPTYMDEKAKSSVSSQENAPNNRMSVPTVKMTRQVTVKTLVTDAFRVRARNEMDGELKLLETQAQQLEAQYQYSMQQLEKIAKQGQNVEAQFMQVNQEAQQKRNQIASLKMQVSAQLGNLDQVENGQYIVTGMLESHVEIAVGDNLYDKLTNAEMLVEDGIIKGIFAG